MMKLANRFKVWIFSAPEGKRSAAEIILWWEWRRIPYNLLVGAAGLCSLMLFYFFISRADRLKLGEDVVEPMALLAAPVIMNLCYTARWVAEMALRKAWPESRGSLGPKLLKVGLKVSLVIIALPTAYWGGYWLLRVTRLIK
jgi:hypothetical protein